MADEEAKKTDTNYIYLGILAAAVLFSIIFFSDSLVRNISIGLAVGSALAVFSAKSSDPEKIAMILVSVAVIYLAITFGSPYLSSSSSFIKNFPLNISAATDPFTCLFNAAACQQQYSYNPSTVQPSSQNSMNLVFQTNYIKENQPISIDSDLSVVNPNFDNLQVTASCFIDNAPISAEPSSFTFSKSPSSQHSVLTCKGDYIAGKKITVKLDADYTSTAVIPISLGTGDSIGKQTSSMPFETPYKISISLGYDQPITKEGTYKMPIVLEKSSNLEIQRLSSLSLSSARAEDIISCPDIPLSNLDRTALKKYLINPDKDTYYFLCNLNPTAADVAGSSQIFYVQSEAIYTAEASFDKALSIIK